MDMVSIILWVAVAAIPLAVLSGWLIGPGERPLGGLINGPDAWWRSTMPWPKGVQEEDDVRWRIPATTLLDPGSAAESMADLSLGAPPTERVGSKVHLRVR